MKEILFKQPVIVLGDDGCIYHGFMLFSRMMDTVLLKF